MKIGGIDVVDFIEQVPVLRLFAKNLALSGGLAFIIQDFLIPLEKWRLKSGSPLSGFWNLASIFLLEQR